MEHFIHVGLALLATSRAELLLGSLEHQRTLLGRSIALLLLGHLDLLWLDHVALPIIASITAGHGS